MQKLTITLQSSFYAYIVQILILWVAIWAALISDLPVAAFLYLLGLLIQIMVTEFAPQPPEILQIDLSGHVRYRNRQERCTKAFTAFKPLMIQLATEQGTVIKIWRDCCSEKEYRRLLVMVGLITDKGD